MSEDRLKNLPALLTQLDPGADLRGRIGNPIPTRNPVVGLFRWIGDDTAVTSLRSQAAIAAALAFCLEEQRKAVEAKDRLQTTVEQFHARRLGLLNPADQERYEDEQHKSELAKKRRERELIDADVEIMEARHRAEARNEFKAHKFEAGAARYAEKIAKLRVGEAVARASMQEEIAEPEPKRAENPKSSATAEMLARLIDDREKEIDEAEAAGRSTEGLRSELKALNTALRRELLRPAEK